MLSQIPPSEPESYESATCVRLFRALSNHNNALPLEKENHPLRLSEIRNGNLFLSFAQKKTKPFPVSLPKKYIQRW